MGVRDLKKKTLSGLAIDLRRYHSTTILYIEAKPPRKPQADPLKSPRTPYKKDPILQPDENTLQPLATPSRCPTTTLDQSYANPIATL